MKTVKTKIWFINQTIVNNKTAMPRKRLEEEEEEEEQMWVGLKFVKSRLSSIYSWTEAAASTLS